MIARQKSLTPPLPAMKARYARLKAKRSSLCDQLQVMEMADGYDHMTRSADHREYCALKIRCEKLRAAIASAEAKMTREDDILHIEAQDLMHNASDEMLRLAVQGEIDLIQLAQWELRSRG